MEIEQNVESRKEKDRIMWFSMWVVLSVASFGIAWFPMIYYMIKRRNDHFSRQEKLEELILEKLKENDVVQESTVNPPKTDKQLLSRNAIAWTALSVLIAPAFYIFYFLKSDLHKHEEHEQEFLTEVRGLTRDSNLLLDTQDFTTSASFPLGKYVVVSVGSFGLAAAYWLYRIFNDYNNHFKMQWLIEDKLLRFLKAIH